MHLSDPDRNLLGDYLRRECIVHQPGELWHMLESQGWSDTAVELSAAYSSTALRLIGQAFAAGIPSIGRCPQVIALSADDIPFYAAAMACLPAKQHEGYLGCVVAKRIKMPPQNRHFYDGKLWREDNAVLLMHTLNESRRVLEVVAALKSLQFHVTDILCIIERDEIGGRQPLEAEGLKVASLFRLSAFVPNVRYQPPRLAA